MTKTFALDLQNPAFDEVNHTISFVALSANPTIKRKGFFGDFYVSIDTDKVQFSAKTFYLDHNVSFESAIGNIAEFKRDESCNLNATLQFSPHIEQSLNAFKKYQKGLSNSVSVGFGDCEILEKDKIDNLPHYHITKGEIVELSAVWQGADPNAVISSFCKDRENTNHTTNFQKEIEMPQTPNPTQGDSMENTNTQADLAEFQALKARKDEEAQIIELGKIANAQDKALEALAQGTSYKDFSFSLLQDKSFSPASRPKEPKQDIDFSLANYALSVAKGERVGDINFKVGTNGYEIPNDYYTRFSAEQTKSIDATSAGFIPEYYRSDKFIEQVFVESNILGLCDKLTGLTGTLRIPRDNSTIKAYWVKEGEKTTPSKLGADSITLSPNTIKAKVLITRQMLGMTPFALESYIVREIKRAIRLRLEEDLLYGEKNDDCPITGIFNAVGVQSITDYFKDTNYKKTLEFESKLSDINLSTANTHFLANSKAKYLLKSTHYDADNEKYLLNGDDLAGYRFVMNNLVQDNHALFGDFSNVLIGTWGGLQVQALKDDEGDLIFTGFYDVGMELKRANAFVVAKS